MGDRELDSGEREVCLSNDFLQRDTYWKAHREAPKKPTDIHFTKNAQKVLISDKFGDVHRRVRCLSERQQREN